MQITESLIEKFFSNCCSGEEAAEVARYLKQNPEVWKKYMIDRWSGEEIAGNMIAGRNDLPGVYKEQMLEQILAATTGSVPGRDRKKVIGMVWRWTAAASILLVVGGLWMFNPNRQKRAPDTASSGSGRKAGGSVDQEEGWQTSSNHTDQKLMMKLEDGSVVTLFPHSTIRYGRHFPENKRDLYLRGQAFFQTAKDRSRPFTVYAGNMATTVLGTSFSVNENEAGVIVKLYSGKVMIRPGSPSVKGWEKDIFLLPGEEMKYETNRGVAAVSTFRDEKLPLRAGSGRAGESNGEIWFDNRELPEVMAKLSRHYRTSIDYKRSELEGMCFSGVVLKTDSLSIILKVIANLNSLTITQTADGFRVVPSRK